MVGSFLVFLWEIVLNGWKRVIGLYLLNLIVYVVLVFFVFKCKYVFFLFFLDYLKECLIFIVNDCWV